MRSTPRATPTVVLVLAALAVAIGTALWVSRARGPSWIDAIAERIEGRGRVVVLGDGSLVEEVRGGLGPVETVALDRFAGVLDGTDEAALVMPDASVDFVFVDADHTEEAVARDIATWTPKVRPGGLIAGHDIRWPTVRRAVAASGPFEEAGHDQVWLRWIK